MGCCNNFGDCCKKACPVCGCTDMCIKCEGGPSDGGCASCLFWGIATVLTFGLVLIIPLLFEPFYHKRCYLVCRRCGYSQPVSARGRVYKENFDE